jgi:hypothetical protein
MQAIRTISKRSSLNSFSQRISGYLFSSFTLLILSASICQAVPISLAWNPSPDQDLASYRVYQSQVSGSYAFGANSQNLSATVSVGTENCNLDVPVVRQYFVVTAVDLDGNESLPSNQAVFTPEVVWSDYRFSVLFRSDDDDAIGVMFRYSDENNYYRFSWNAEEGYRRLVRRRNGRFKVMAEDAVPYESRRIYELEIVADGGRIEVRIDGEKIFSVKDKPSFGTVALYSWQNDHSYFADPRVVDLNTG